MAFKIIPTAEITQQLTSVKKPLAYANRPLSFTSLEPRAFEVLLYTIFKRRIESKDPTLANHCDHVDLMQGVGEQGQDCILTHTGKRVGLIQCKRFETRLSRPTVAKEIIKFILYYFVDKSLIDDPKNYTYYLAVARGFSGTATTLIAGFNQKIAEDKSTLKLYTEEVIQNPNARSLNHIKYSDIESELIDVLRHIKIEKITPEDIEPWLSQHSDILGQFFQIRSVVDASLTRDLIDLRRQSSFSVPDHLQFIKKYLTELGELTKYWHIPHELRPLITWEVSPIEINKYFELKPLKISSALSAEKYSLSAALTFSSPLFLVGNAGAGKSTFLKYLTHNFCTLAVDQLTTANVFDTFQIPILITLRDYGPVRLIELVTSQLRQFGWVINSKSVEQLLDVVSVILLLDGLDEVKNSKRDDILIEVVNFHRNFPKQAIVITVRKQPETSLIEGVSIFEIQALNERAIEAFVFAHLGRLGDSFLGLIEDSNISEIVQVPLLLTLCLVVFKVSDTNPASLAEIYQRIVKLYETKWENPKRHSKHEKPIEWELLQETVICIAFEMVDEETGYNIPRSQLVPVLENIIEQFIRSKRWSSQHTLYDLFNQLLECNFLKLHEDNVSFWHSSFRDYFAALKTVSLPQEQIEEYVADPVWAPIMAFVGGMLEEPESLCDLLVDMALEGESDEKILAQLRILAAMGNKSTKRLS